MALLFRAHRDLLEEFTYFLPDSSPPQQPQAEPSVAACMYVENLRGCAPALLVRPVIVLHELKAALTSFSASHLFTVV